MKKVEKLELSTVHLSEVVLKDDILEKMRGLMTSILEEELGYFYISEGEEFKEREIIQSMLIKILELMEIRTEYLAEKENTTE